MVGLGRVILITIVIFAPGSSDSAVSTLWLSLAFLTIVGFGMMVQMASTNTVIQTIVDDEKRGRVMSFYTMSFLGTAPFGSLLAGRALDAHRRAAHRAVERCTVLRDGVWFAGSCPLSARWCVRSTCGWGFCRKSRTACRPRRT